MGASTRDYQDIIEHYGVAEQMGVLQEEAAEVIQAVSKLRRHGKSKETVAHLSEEVADFLVVVNELVSAGELNYDSIHAVMDRKVKRELKRIEEEKQNEG